VPQSIETPAPNAFLTASIQGRGGGELSRINKFIKSQAGHITTFPPLRAGKNP